MATASGTVRTERVRGQFFLPAVITGFLALMLGILGFNQFLNAMTLGAIYALIALGYTMVYGIIELINHYKIALSGAEVVVIGRGLTVGRPLGLLLTRKQENATVTLTHTGTKDLTIHTMRADIIVAAIGKAHFLKAEMVKSGATVIDVGISRTESGLLGDVDPGVSTVAAFIAPMPGGVGPMTRAMLLTNVVDACER